MSNLTLTKAKLISGMWEGILETADTTPEVAVTHLEQEVSGVQLRQGKEDNTWLLQVPIPSEAISDGIQTILIKDQKSQRVLEKITIIAGEALGDDVRAEVDLLRAELDMLKRAFRKHCLETMN